MTAIILLIFAVIALAWVIRRMVLAKIQIERDWWKQYGQEESKKWDDVLRADKKKEQARL